MLGLSTLGFVHTLLGVVALVAGAACFVQDGAITTRSFSGRLFVVTTALTCVTGFGIFQRGGANIAHVLGVVTLVTLGVALWAERQEVVGKLSVYVATVGYSLTYFFHWIPGTTETFTRFPVGAPLFSSPEDPALEQTVGVMFLLFLIGAAIQVRRIRQRHRSKVDPRLAASLRRRV
jgi:hypothetical protein